MVCGLPWVFSFQHPSKVLFADIDGGRSGSLILAPLEAPNDKIRYGQKETLLLSDSVKRWVVEVEDINPPSSLDTSRISTQLQYKISTQTENVAAYHKAEYEIQNLATLSDALKGEGLWTDVMKEVVFLATQGKLISKNRRNWLKMSLENEKIYMRFYSHSSRARQIELLI